MKKPPRLKRGATIGVAAVSGPVDGEKLELGISRLLSLGYRVVKARNLGERRGFLAGPDSERAAAYLDLLRDEGVDAIFFARGGYGSSRVLRLMDADTLRANPKIHMGGSDLTALFAFLSRGADLATFYGPMVAVEIAREGGLDWERVLAGETPAPHEFAPEQVLAGGRGEGPLVGGCLSLLASLAGTPDAVRADGRILFWEDVGEEIYRLDRLLTQLERSGTFDGLQGMVIGSVVAARTDSPRQVEEYLRERFSAARYPVGWGLPAGHLDRPRTLPLGLSVRLDLDGDRRLSFAGPAVV